MAIDEVHILIGKWQLMLNNTNSIRHRSFFIDDSGSGVRRLMDDAIHCLGIDMCQTMKTPQEGLSDK
jgi:hypothetical protein